MNARLFAPSVKYFNSLPRCVLLSQINCFLTYHFSFHTQLIYLLYSSFLSYFTSTFIFIIFYYLFSLSMYNSSVQNLLRDVCVRIYIVHILYIQHETNNRNKLILIFIDVTCYIDLYCFYYYTFTTVLSEYFFLSISVLFLDFIFMCVKIKSKILLFSFLILVSEV